ncbi:MAG: hypothetical protein P4L74_05915 [Candidatus Doudnabacteria bacterium]|nr:hypothetical protein [Candidatus Doudnabacteria bacterium]
MKIHHALLFTLAIFLCASPTAFAQQTQTPKIPPEQARDTRKAIDKVIGDIDNILDAGLNTPPANRIDVDKIVACLMRKGCGNWMFWKQDLDGSVTAIFVQNDFRYTIFVDGSGNKGRRLVIWTRKQNETNRDKVDVFTDTGLDGKINGASDGKRLRKFSESANEGMQWRGYWQLRYNQAIKATIAFMAHHPTH